ncbi:AAA family ATPase [Streptomyces sp. NRRL S-350]|uniref:AAA family ATPase n=1 Tax=Streptomyces sp. NRRL S-350 TaxID=1463902 RepID=UPI0004BEA966|nr:AAA family ATPase [Streptomyces sp. NRRL S-350]
MSIRTCTVVAVEGTAAAGKTTLVHALTSYYRERGVNVACTGEPARVNPFLEEIVLHGQGTFDLTAELDAFAVQLSTILRGSRHHTLLITDKTPANVLAYARLVLDRTDPVNHAVIASMEAMCRAWMPASVDLIVHCRDRFDQRSGGDRMREKVIDLQDATAAAVHEACAATGVKMVDLPTSLDTQSRVRWIADRVSELGLLAA